MFLIPIEVLGCIMKVKNSQETNMYDVADVIEVARLMNHTETVEWLLSEDNLAAYYDFLRKGIVAKVGNAHLVLPLKEVDPDAVKCDDCGHLLNGRIGEHIVIDVADLTHAQKEETEITESKNLCRECFDEYAPHLNFDDFHHGC